MHMSGYHQTIIMKRRIPPLIKHAPLCESLRSSYQANVS